MATEFFKVHDIYERRNIILNTLKLMFNTGQYSGQNIGIKYCNTAKGPDNLANAVYFSFNLFYYLIIFLRY